MEPETRRRPTGHAQCLDCGRATGELRRVYSGLRVAEAIRGGDRRFVRCPFFRPGWRVWHRPL